MTFKIQSNSMYLCVFKRRIIVQMLERNFCKKMFVNPKSGISSGSIFTSIPTLNLMFCKVSSQNQIEILTSIFMKFSIVLFSKVGCVTKKLKLFWRKIKTCPTKKNDTPWRQNFSHFLGPRKFSYENHDLEIYAKLGQDIKT